jgi:Immunoglobulin-like domain of bacterial spore germination
MTDERRDDEILGRALSRAIETIDVNQTPYERSRIATAPARRSIFGLWQVATAAVAVVLALAIGSWLTRPTEPGPVAGSPTPTIAPATQPGATQPEATQTPAPSGATVSTRVFFVRDLLPPLSANVPSGGAHIGVDRVVERITAAHAAPPSSVPAGAVNPLGVVPLRADGTSVSAKINGDTAEVEFDASGGWGVHGAAQVQALVQQLVYVITEEPGIRKARITEKGKASAVIDGLIVDRPLSREDVTDYSFAGSIGKAQGISGAGDDSVAHVGARMLAAVSDGTRAAITLEGRTQNGAVANLPSFDAWLEQSDDTTTIGAKYTLYVQFRWNGGGNSNGAADVTMYDQTPLRAVTTNGNDVFRIELDDARPWRAYMPSASQLVIEIGGDPRATSDRIAVTAPKPGAIVNSGADLTVTGSARVFEANVVWRLVDASGKVVANGHFLSSLGSSAVWGTFNTKIAMPANVRGNLTLEFYEASARDGTPQGVVQIPLTVR